MKTDLSAPLSPDQPTVIRAMKADDFPFADEVRALAGWNQTAADWQRFLNCEPQGCFIGEKNGRPAGTATTVYYGPGLGWIGMLLVHPDCRRSGIGLALLQHSLRSLQRRGARCVKLDATPLGQPLYARTGFQPCGSLTRWETPALDPAIGRIGEGVSCLSEVDFDNVVSLDQRGFGYPRPRLLQDLIPRSLCAIVRRASGATGFGYGMLREGSRAHYLGPVMAQNLEAAVVIIRHLLGQVPGRPIYWDVPVQNRAATELAASIGFAPQRQLVRMFHGEQCPGGDWSVQYAIADPAVG